MKISIIVPVYNGEKTIRELLFTHSGINFLIIYGKN